VTVALAEIAPLGASELDWVLALVDMPELERRGWDATTRRFVPAPTDPLFGYARCPVRGCENVTEHTASSLCARCQSRYGRWLRKNENGDLDGFLASVTQVRSENPERIMLEVLVGLTVSIERPRRSRITELRRGINRLRAAGVGSLLEIDARKIASDSVRLFIEFAQDRLRLAAADPDTEFEKAVWDLRVFGSTRAWRMDFTAIRQPWLRVLAKEWAREKVSAVHPHGLTT
jgi:hypothetical protein